MPLIAIDDLVLDAADPRSDDRTRLPHRFGDGESESLRDALLHDHVGPPLQRVHDRRVLLEVVHRQARQVHALPRGAVEARDEVPGLFEDLGSFRIVGHGAHRRARIHEVRVSPGRDVLDEALDDAERILQPVPARDLEHHRILGPQRAFFQQLSRAAHSRSACRPRG